VFRKFRQHGCSGVWLASLTIGGRHGYLDLSLRHQICGNKDMKYTVGRNPDLFQCFGYRNDSYWFVKILC
jgi:hypothetical protein